MIRNLLYNCCALEGSDAWRLNIEELCKYQNIFNGQRVVLIKTGENIIAPEIVKAAFELPGTRFILWPNDPAVQEGAGFVEALGLLKSNREDEITFYAHTKGVTYKEDSPIKVLAVRAWRNRMYRECLSNPFIVDKTLSKYACAGCFRVPFHVDPIPKNIKWHFSGTFWWVNHAKLFSKPNWAKVEPSPWGVEGYLGGVFDINESYCFYSKWVGKQGLYSVEAQLECRNCKAKFKSWVNPFENSLTQWGQLPHEPSCPECGAASKLVEVLRAMAD